MAPYRTLAAAFAAAAIVSSEAQRLGERPNDNERQRQLQRGRRCECNPTPRCFKFTPEGSALTDDDECDDVCLREGYQAWKVGLDLSECPDKGGEGMDGSQQEGFKKKKRDGVRGGGIGGGKPAREKRPNGGPRGEGGEGGRKKRGGLREGGGGPPRKKGQRGRGGGGEGKEDSANNDVVVSGVDDIINPVSPVDDPHDDDRDAGDFWNEFGGAGPKMQPKSSEEEGDESDAVSLDALVGTSQSEGGGIVEAAGVSVKDKGFKKLEGEVTSTPEEASGQQQRQQQPPPPLPDMQPGPPPKALEDKEALVGRAQTGEVVEAAGVSVMDKGFKKLEGVEASAQEEGNGQQRQQQQPPPPEMQAGAPPQALEEDKEALVGKARTTGEVVEAEGASDREHGFKPLEEARAEAERPPPSQDTQPGRPGAATAAAVSAKPGGDSTSEEKVEDDPLQDLTSMNGNRSPGPPPAVAGKSTMKGAFRPIPSDDGDR